MSELHDRLRTTLAELHSELAALGPADPESRALLEEALRDIQQSIGGGSVGHGPAGGASIVSRLKHLAERFEESHPTLSGTLGSAIDALGRMGI